MGWKDRLQPASFRNVPFVVESHETSSGRRLVQHQFPGKDVGVTEDQGRSPVEHSVTAIVHGEDFDLAATELERALQKGGWGDLVLPHLGRRTVVISRYRRSSPATAQRMTTFAIEAREVGFANFATPQADPARQIGDAGAAARAAATEEAAAEMTADGPGFIRAASEAAASAMTAAMRAVTFVQGVQKDVAAFVSKVQTITTTISELISAPADLVASLIDAVDAIKAAGMGPLDAFSAYRGMFGLPAGLKGGSTPQERAADANRQAIVDAVRLAASTNAAEMAAEVEWESVDAAIDARDVLFEEIDDLSLRAGDATFAALQDLRAQILATIPGTTLSAPPALIVTTAETAPALALAYRYLDDPGQADAIAKANRVANPLFVPGGAEIRIVRNGG